MKWIHCLRRLSCVKRNLLGMFVWFTFIVSIGFALYWVFSYQSIDAIFSENIKNEKVAQEKQRLISQKIQTGHAQCDDSNKQLQDFCKRLADTKDIKDLFALYSLIDNEQQDVPLKYKARSNFYDAYMESFSLPLAVALGFLAIAFVIKIEIDRLDNERKHNREQAKDNLENILTYGIELLENIDRKSIDFMVSYHELVEKGIVPDLSALLRIENNQLKTCPEFLDCKNLFSIDWRLHEDLRMGRFKVSKQDLENPCTREDKYGNRIHDNLSFSIRFLKKMIIELQNYENAGFDKTRADERMVRFLGIRHKLECEELALRSEFGDDIVDAALEKNEQDLIDDIYDSATVRNRIDLLSEIERLKLEKEAIGTLSAKESNEVVPHASLVEAVQILLALEAFSSQKKGRVRHIVSRSIEKINETVRSNKRKKNDFFGSLRKILAAIFLSKDNARTEKKLAELSCLSALENSRRQERYQLQNTLDGVRQLYFNAMAKNWEAYENNIGTSRGLHEEVGRLQEMIEEILLKKDFDHQAEEYQKIFPNYLKILNSLKQFENIIEGVGTGAKRKGIFEPQNFEMTDSRIVIEKIKNAFYHRSFEDSHELWKEMHRYRNDSNPEVYLFFVLHQLLEEAVPLTAYKSFDDARVYEYIFKNYDDIIVFRSSFSHFVDFLVEKEKSLKTMLEHVCRLEAGTASVVTFQLDKDKSIKATYSGEARQNTDAMSEVWHQTPKKLFDKVMRIWHDIFVDSELYFDLFLDVKSMRLQLLDKAEAKIDEIEDEEIKRYYETNKNNVSFHCREENFESRYYLLNRYAFLKINAFLPNEEKISNPYFLRYLYLDHRTWFFEHTLQWRVTSDDVKPEVRFLAYKIEDHKRKQELVSALDRRNVDNLRNLAIEYFNVDDYEKCAEVERHMLRLIVAEEDQERYREVLHDFISTLKERKQYQEALTIADELIGYYKKTDLTSNDKREHYIELLVDQILIYDNLNQYEDVLSQAAILEPVLEGLNKENETFLWVYGRALMHTEKYSEAILQYEKYFELLEKNEQTYVEVADLPTYIYPMVNYFIAYRKIGDEKGMQKLSAAVSRKIEDIKKEFKGFDEAIANQADDYRTVLQDLEEDETEYALYKEKKEIFEYLFASKA